MKRSGIGPQPSAFAEALAKAGNFCNLPRVLAKTFVALFDSLRCRNLDPELVVRPRFSQIFLLPDSDYYCWKFNNRRYGKNAAYRVFNTVAER